MVRILIGALLFLPAAGGGAENGALTVKMKKFHNSDGQALVALFAGKAGFPTKPSKAKRTTKVKISGGTATATFSDLEPGEYAVSVVHDENGNGKLDTNFIGIPKEGLAASNNAQGRMGPPKYKDAKLRVPKGKLTIAVDLVYL